MIKHIQGAGYGSSLVGVMKVGNITHRTGIQPTALEIPASVLSITPLRLPDVTTYPCLSGSLLERSVPTIG